MRHCRYADATVTQLHAGVAWVRVVLVVLLAAALHAGAAAASPVSVLRVHDAIGPASADYIVRGLTHAQQANAPLVVIELDTPGGLDSAMREIIQAILASPVPVATWVAPEGARAASAGTYILYASHVAAMAPATTLGAATPVAMGMPGAEPPAAPGSAPQQGKPAGDAMTAKRVNDAAAFIRGLAQQRGRNAEWAERAVREAVSLTADEALAQRVVDVVAASVPDLLAQIDGRTVHTSAGEVRLATRDLPHGLRAPGWRHRLLSVIANPSFALILMTIGIYGLMFEFSSPGFGVAGVVGAICLLLALFALQMLPISYAGLALVLLGIALLAAEVVSPTFGVLGAGGFIAFVAGGVLLIDSDVPGYGVPLPLVIGLAAASALFTVVGGGMALRARRQPVQGGLDDWIGARGEVIALTPHESWALVRGERWQVSADAPLAIGQRVRVDAVQGLVLHVTPDAETVTPSKKGPSS